MKFGSMTNLIMNSIKPEHPQVGMGCTVLSWTDRHPATIIKVSPSGKTFQFTYDLYRRTDTNGWSEVQEYEYISNPDASPHTARLTKSGRYKCKGQTVLVGTRERYYDPHF